MTDIRARLADALRQIDYNALMYGDKKSYEEQADCLLSLPGIAIIDPDDEATIDRVHKAIWDENGRRRNPEIGVVERHRNMARAALAAAVQAQEPK